MIRILVDSSSDFTKEEIAARNIDMVPINIIIGDKVYEDKGKKDRDRFYELIEKTGEFPTTSQPSPEHFLTVFEAAKEAGDEVICILLSSALSGTVQCAHLAKSLAEYDKIHIVDSLGATRQIMVLADKALKMRDEGASVSDIVLTLESLKSRVHLMAYMDTLDFLKRGGRISPAIAGLAGLANIKVLITLNDEGKVDQAAKCIGKNKALGSLVKLLDQVELDPEYPVYTIFSSGTENCEKLEEKLTKAGHTFEDRLQIGLTIGTHIGPRAAGLVYVSKK